MDSLVSGDSSEVRLQASVGMNSVGSEERAYGRHQREVRINV